MLSLDKQFLLAEAGLVKEGESTTLQGLYSPLFDTLLILQQVRADKSYRIQAAPLRTAGTHVIATAFTYDDAQEKFLRASHDLPGISRKFLVSDLQEDRAKRKAYTWENVCLNALDHHVSAKEFTRIARECSRLVGLTDSSIEFGTEQRIPGGPYARESAVYKYNGNSIYVPYPMRTPVTAAHEVTHSCLNHNQKGGLHLFHGPAFIRLATVFYGRVLNASIEGMVEYARKENIWGLDPENRISRRVKDLQELCDLPEKQFLPELRNHVLFKGFVNPT